MTYQQILEALQNCEDSATKSLWPVCPEEYDQFGYVPTWHQAHRHILHMIREIRELLPKRRNRKKVMQILCFVQGALWREGLLCLNDTELCNKPIGVDGHN